MSSHYLVTEDQEPALIIANGEECSMSLLQQMMAWSPFVVALDGAYNRLQRMGVKPQLVIGDFDSLQDYEPLPDVSYIKLEEQDTTDLEKALNWLEENDYKDVNVLWATGKRLDHTLNNLSILGMYPSLNVVLYDDHSKAYMIPNRFSKHFQKGEQLSLLPLGTVEGIATQNLKYPLDKEALTLGHRSGNSNEVLKDGLVEIAYEQGKLVLIESRDEA